MSMREVIFENVFFCFQISETFKLKDILNIDGSKLSYALKFERFEF